MRAVDVLWPGRGASPGVAKQFLDGEQAHPRQVMGGGKGVAESLPVSAARAPAPSDPGACAARVRGQGWSPQQVAAVRAAEAGDERGSGRGPDLDVRAEGGEQRRERWGIGVLEVKGLQGEPARR